jgi:hypothetical protein
MGAAADLKVTEIETARAKLEHDLRELEARLPAPLRSAKSAAGLLLGGTVLAALLLRKRGSKPSKQRPAAEVVIRVVREDTIS